MKFEGRKMRLTVVGVAVAMIVAALATNAFGVFPNDSVASYAGCLNTSGSASGTVTNLALGDTPTRPCSVNQTLVHLSGGDITAVRTASGSGLVGGTDNGAAALALDSSGCSSGGVLKWNGVAWQCGTDSNSTYSAGTGLTLSGSQFSISSPYRLPQSCSSGQIAKSAGPNSSWTCGTDAVGGLANAYLGSSGTLGDRIGLDNNQPHTVVSMNVPGPALYTVAAKGQITFPSLGSVVCQLRYGAGPILDEQEIAVGSTEDTIFVRWSSAVSLLGTVSVSDAANELYVSCDAAGDGVGAYAFKILATRVGAIH